ncbi:MAG: hypothetical protein AAGC81_08890 [Pseudomonadota bacterium]
MRNAALVLGIIGGIVGMFVGFFAYGWAELGNWFVTETGVGQEYVGTDEERQEAKLIGLGAPILAIAGGAMAASQPVAAAVLMAGAAFGIYYGFGFGLFTMFPIAMCALGAALALIGKLLGRDETIS